MKKMLIFMLVLGLATVANAHFIFTIGGEPTGQPGGEPQPTEIWIMPSDMVELDLEVSADEKIAAFDLAYILDNDQAELIWDNIQFPTVFDMPGKVYPWSDPQYVEIGGGQVNNPPLQGPLVVMNNLFLHCLDETDVTLTIEVADVTLIGQTGEEELEIGTILHTLIIHQVPEPTTMLLLGLGGLLLRRRK